MAGGVQKCWGGVVPRVARACGGRRPEIPPGNGSVGDYLRLARARGQANRIDTGVWM